MIWHMDTGTWMYYFALPWGTFVFSVVYGIIWYTRSKRKDNARDDIK